MLKKIESTRGHTISIRIPLDVYAELEAVKGRAEAVGHTVSIVEDVTEAIRKVCIAANDALDRVEEKIQIAEEIGPVPEGR